MTTSWPEPAPRRSISTATRPSEMNRFYSSFFPDRRAVEGPVQGYSPLQNGDASQPMPPALSLPAGVVPSQAPPPHFFHEEPAAYCLPPGRGFDPCRFSPPQLDTPPADTRPSFSFDAQSQQWQPMDVEREKGQQMADFSSPGCTEALGHGLARLSFPQPLSQQQHLLIQNTTDECGRRGESLLATSSFPVSHPPPSHRMSVSSIEGSASGSVCFSSLQRRPFAADKARSVSFCARKPSVMALKSLLRTPRVDSGDSRAVREGETAIAEAGQVAGAVQGGAVPSAPSGFFCSSSSSFTPYTPPPILSPLRSGSGLYCNIRADDSERNEGSGEEDEDGEGREVEEEMAEEQGETEQSPSDSAATPSDGAECRRDAAPTRRKNGFFYMANQHDQMSMALELEALRKDSWASSSSTKSTPCIAAERKKSLYDAVRKASSISDCYYECHNLPQQTDANPHINIGPTYQARVKKWAERDIAPEEREAIPDRDELVFDTKLVDHLSTEQLAAYEQLACSRAVPRPGRNKELALHLLVENKGNIEAAVMDLLRSETLDWEQYPIIYNSSYVDTTPWTPEQIALFQDALYKTEKDFHLVAQELGMPVAACVEWYYTWKKALPDDYRKLRNLRRKRKLLQMQMDAEGAATAGPSAKSLCNRENTIVEDIEEMSSDDMDLSSDLAGVSKNESLLLPPHPSQQTAAGLIHPFAGLFGPPPPLQISPVDRPRLNSVGAPSSCSPMRKSSGSGGYPHSSSPMQGVGAMMIPRSGSMSGGSSSGLAKKGAQPAADGFFHCRLCDKCFEKVKSLNAHMKSHAMKARAEAEARAHWIRNEQQPSSTPSPSSLFLAPSANAPAPPFNVCSSAAAVALQLSQAAALSVSSPSTGAPPRLDMEGQLQQLGLASQLLGLEQHLLQQAGINPSTPLSQLHLTAPSLIH